jgi:hypothetical protein
MGLVVVLCPRNSASIGFDGTLREVNPISEDFRKCQQPITAKVSESGMKGKFQRKEKRLSFLINNS